MDFLKPSASGFSTWKPVFAQKSETNPIHLRPEGRQERPRLFKITKLYRGTKKYQEVIESIFTEAVEGW